jgi:hypothetical protein
MRRLLSSLMLVGLVTAFVAPGPATAQQSFTFYVGGFAPRGEDARTRSSGGSDDVLVNNLSFLAFNIGDFTGGTIGGEWLVGLSDYLEGGLGLGVYSKTVPSVYADFVNDDFSEIEQDLKLRVIPFTATVRFLPLGRRAGIQPFIGGGVGVLRWRYSETGQFVDFGDSSIFRDSFVGTGAAAAPVVLGGARVPIGSWDIGGEIRYQGGEGDLPEDQGFSATKIDLGGFNYLVTFNVRF